MISVFDPASDVTAGKESHFITIYKIIITIFVFYWCGNNTQAPLASLTNNNSTDALIINIQVDVRIFKTPRSLIEQQQHKYGPCLTCSSRTTTTRTHHALQALASSVPIALV